VWVRQLGVVLSNAKKTLDQQRPRFIVEVRGNVKSTWEELSKVQNEIQNFSNYYDIQEAEAYHTQSMQIQTVLEGLMIKAEEINEKESLLKYELTDFTVIEFEHRKFQKFVDLWEFVFTKWQWHSENWMGDLFKDLDKDMMSTIINYGSDLLVGLVNEFADNPHISEVVKTLQTEVKKYQEILKFVMIMKDDCFKTRHWDRLYKEMYVNQTVRPDPKKTTLRKLLEDRLLSYHSTLLTIITEARSESKTEKKITEIEDSIKSIKIRTTQFDKHIIPLNYIQDVKKIISILNDHHSTCKVMMTNPEYPEIFLERLHDLGKLVHTTRKTLKFFDHIQSKLVKFSPIFKYKSLENYFTKKDIFEKFFKLKEEFKHIMDLVHSKNMAFFSIFIDEKPGNETSANDLKRKFGDLQNLTDYIQTNLANLFKGIRQKCPRYYFLSEDQMFIICSLLKFPQSLFSFISNMFKGIKEIKLKDFKTKEMSDELKIQGLVNFYDEDISFEDELIIDTREEAEIPLIAMVEGLEEYNLKYFRDCFRNHLYEISDRYGYDYSGIYQYSKENGII
jgi:hypothetical protein